MQVSLFSSWLITSAHSEDYDSYDCIFQNVKTKWRSTGDLYFRVPICTAEHVLSR